MSDDTRECVLVNFRSARGLNERVYRCGTTDNLATVVESPCTAWMKSERIILHDITLSVDLRSKQEVDLEKAEFWTNRAAGGSFKVVEGPENALQTNVNKMSVPTRAVVRCNLISNVFHYIDTQWLSDVESSELQDYASAMGHRMNAIKEHGGLVGLFQVILEANHHELGLILKLITVNLEQNGKVIVNCTQGKDRTGLVIMLLQSAAGVEEEDIVADFAESHRFDQSRRGSAAMQAAAERLKMDTSVLSGAPPQVMEETLAFLSREYGSVSPSFLNEIGFDESWRKRLIAGVE